MTGEVTGRVSVSVCAIFICGRGVRRWGSVCCVCGGWVGIGRKA